MLFLRSLAFNIYLFSGTFVMAFIVILIAPVYKKSLHQGTQIWTRYGLWGLKLITGIDYEVRGIENLPQNGALIACKHQSAWDTAIFLSLRPSTAYVVKKELIKIPFYGPVVERTHISVDRAGGASALKKMVHDVKSSLENGANVVIFPEGTRSIIGKPGTYHSGIAALYTRTEQPVIPVAVNSGLYWGRRSFIKRPGTIIIDILPAIEPGLKSKIFLNDLQETIEKRTRLLEKEGSRKDNIVI